MFDFALKDDKKDRSADNADQSFRSSVTSRITDLEDTENEEVKKVNSPTNGGLQFASSDTDKEQEDTLRKVEQRKEVLGRFTLA